MIIKSAFDLFLQSSFIFNALLTMGVGKLERIGLVERKPYDKDRRSYFVVLTDKGEEVFEEHHRFHEDFTREVAAELTNQILKP